MIRLIDRFLAWLRPLVLLPPRCHVTWHVDDPADWHACRLTAGHEGRCRCFCGSQRFKDGAIQRVIFTHKQLGSVMDDRD